MTPRLSSVSFAPFRAKRAFDGRRCYGIDAFSQEPPAGTPLLELDNTVVTPHLAGATLDNIATVVARSVENAKAVLRGDPLPADDVAVAPGKVTAH